MRVSYIALVAGSLLIMSSAHAAKISDIANTTHNLSMTWGGEGADPRTVSATSEAQICVFCHTPHGANTSTSAPLWNRSLEGEAVYSMYDSSSMEATQLSGVPSAPTSSSKLCLSCHDGVIAVGAVNVLNGAPATIAMNGTGTGGVMPDGSGADSGNTRNIGTDLTNDHPISFTYDTALATADGELNDPMASPHVGVRGPGVRPLIPLIPDPLDGNTPKLECVSCHDPHVRDSTGVDIKFLRLNRFQTNSDPVGGYGGNPNSIEFNPTNDIICLACHNKEGWVDSAHASQLVANEAYNNSAAAERDFPNGIQVWQAACLNCHDTHTVAGSRRLLREGVSDQPSPSSPAIEETCYQCHASEADAGYVLEGSNPQVPDIKSDFQLARHMPITTTAQMADTEVHDIGNTGIAGDGKEFIETPLNLGKGNLMNRHAECTDCHNPHRVTKNRLATDAPSNPAAAGTHDHNLTDGATEHSNLISGVLRGTWGVEPSYGFSAFGTSPISYTIKKGVPPQNGSSLVTAPYVTREYQVCLKCHSDYAFDDLNPPALGYSGGTPPGTNGVIFYTNQAMEFQSPLHHQGSPLQTNDSGAFSGQVVGYKYFEYEWDSLYWTWRPKSPLALNTMSTDCDGWSPDDASCVCEVCSTGATLLNFDQTVTTCGLGDVDTFASTGTPGFSDSPWDGLPWSGGGAAPVPYFARKCTKTVDYSSNNHRSWHSVMEPTGRTATIRDMGGDTSAFLPPWSAGVGTQTMYCSDCHGSDTAAGTAVPSGGGGGEDGNPWGPHGSDNNFLLKGGWDEETGSTDPNGLCFKCHNYDAYGNPNTTVISPSGFSSAVSMNLCGFGPTSETGVNLHTAHATFYGMPGVGSNFRCTSCHVAVPHGWKNKALLVNLKDVGPEAGLSPGTVIHESELPYNNAPYYLNAVNYIYNFRPSGQWRAEDCGDSDTPGRSGMLAVCGTLP